MLMCNPAVVEVKAATAATAAVPVRKKARQEWRNFDMGMPELPPPNPNRNPNPSRSSGPVPSPSPSPGPGAGRINLHDIKARIVKRVGTERASRYFRSFRRFLGCELTKEALEKSVVACIGAENVALHNQLVRAVLHNALSHNNGLRPCPPCHIVGSEETPPRPLSLEKKKNGTHDHRAGAGASPDSHRPAQKTLGMAEQLNLFAKHPKTLEELPPKPEPEPEPEPESESEPEPELELEPDNAREDMDSLLKRIRHTVTPPLGVFRSLPFAASPTPPRMQFPPIAKVEETLHQKTESIAASQGLDAVNPECTALLKQAKATFLKRLIKLCVDIRNEGGGLNRLTHTGINGITHDTLPTISMRDLKVAMELNPRQLGENWALQLEKIDFRLFEQ